MVGFLRACFWTFSSCPSLYTLPHHLITLGALMFCAADYHISFSSLHAFYQVCWASLSTTEDWIRANCEAHWCLMSSSFGPTHVHWVSDAIQPSHPLLSPSTSCLQSFPVSGYFPMSQFFGGPSIGASASASVILMNIQDWFPLGWTGWISLQSKGLSRLFSSTTVWKHKFFGAQLNQWKDCLCKYFLNPQPRQGLQMYLLQIQKMHTPLGSIHLNYVTLLKSQNYGDVEQSSCEELGVGGQVWLRRGSTRLEW